MKENEIIGTVDMSRSGHAYLKTEDESVELFINKSELSRVLNGDTIRVESIEDKEGNKTIVVKEIVSRAVDTFSGVISIKRGEKNYAFVKVSGNKTMVDIFVPIEKIGEAQDGDAVVIKMTSWKKGEKCPRGSIVKTLGQANTHGAEMGMIMNKHNIDYTFPQEVLDEAELISEVIFEKEISKRKDMRDVLTIGIDPENSKDADDTIGYQVVNDEIEISVNISDVTFYVKPGTELDKEALKRGTSIYFVDKVRPMFPERLSNNICSLKSGSDKLSFSSIFRFNQKGEIVHRWFGRTIINVNKDYSYEDAQMVIENGSTEENKNTDEVVIELNKIAEKLRKERLKNSVLSIESREVRFELDENNKPVGIVFKESKSSNKLIEEFMLLANAEVSKFIKSKKLPCINRVHEKPSEEKLESLKLFVKQFGYEIKTGSPEEIKSSLNKMLEESKSTPEANIISTLVTRTQQKAYYTTLNLGHYGLDFKYYSHFTSPIRRMADVLTHRILAVAIGNDGYNNR